jgi:hypothetical protein
VHGLDVLHLIVPDVHEHVKQAVTRRPPQRRIITAACLQLVKLQYSTGQDEASLIAVIMSSSISNIAVN